MAPTADTLARGNYLRTHNMTTETQALALLSKGLSQEVVAQACGVTPGRISQLMENEEFKNAVTERRIAELSRGTELDGKYDKLEERTLDMLEKRLPLVKSALEAARILQTLNGAKRRAQSVLTPAESNAPDRLVAITLPNVIVNKYVTNVVNQVVAVQSGDSHESQQSLVTTSTGGLNKLLESRKQNSSRAISGPSDAKELSQRQAEGSRVSGEITAEDL